MRQAVLLRTKLLTVVVLLGLVAAGLSAYYGSSRRAPTTFAGPVETITLGTDANLLTAAVRIAARKGYFRDEGLQVTIKEFQTGRLALEAMLRAEPLDIVTVAVTPFVLKSFDRQDIRIVATFVDSQDDDSVIANTDRGIGAVADLAGKRIGFPKGTSAHFFLEAVLVEAGLSPSQVAVVDIRPGDLPSALANQQVDAISIWEPFASRAQELLKSRAVKLSPAGTHRATFNFVAMQDFTQGRQPAIRKFLKAIERANLFIGDNKEEARTILAEELKLETAIIAKLMPKYNYRLFLDQLLVLDLEGQARWAVKSKLTDKTVPPNYLEFVFPDALRATKPEAVTLVTPARPKAKENP